MRWDEGRYSVMSREAHLPMSRKLARGGFVVLALVALFVALARPLCGAHRLQGDAPGSGPVIAAAGVIGEAAPHGRSGTCCSSMHDGSLVVSVPVAEAFKSPAAAVLTAASPPAWRVASASLVAPIPPHRPPGLKPYYARSARILI
jgi:hypothetical protein